MTKTANLKIGLALGAGSARGWAHIGVIRALTEADIKPDIVCGTSIGALVGAAYANNELDRLENWVSGLTWRNVVRFLDLSLNGGGLIKGTKVIDFFRQNFVDLEIQQLSRPFAAVATDLYSGREIWLRDGKVSDAVRASIAVPGLFRPVERDGRILLDGSLVNPVPVSLCRAMGADVVIAVDLNAAPMERHRLKTGAERKTSSGESKGYANILLSRLAKVTSIGAVVDSKGGLPSLLDVLSISVNIMQVRITRSRLAGEPADVLVTPQLASMGLMEYHLAPTAIAAGRQAAAHVLHQIHDLLQHD